MKKQNCVRCLFDSDIAGISFNAEGLCLYCEDFDRNVLPLLKKNTDKSYSNLKLQEIASEIKKKGRKRKYDCLIGLSGGIDSSYVAYQVNKLGLRPLAFHLDNGWNTDTSVKNIRNIINKLDIDLYTHVIEWEEFRDMQLSFLKAGVVDVELLTDHAITAVAFQLIKKEKIKYFISGSNHATEAIMPVGWSHSKWDRKNITSIHKQFGSRPIKTYPHYGFINKIQSQSTFKVVHLLNYIDYNKEQAMEILKEKLGWEYYGGKHYESVFTKFYQAYILPQKFNIDKRKAHLSTLICAGQLTKEEALIELEKPLYSSDNELHKEIDYVLKKLGLTYDEFDAIMSETPKSHLEYPNGMFMNALFKKVKKFLL